MGISSSRYSHEKEERDLCTKPRCLWDSLWMSNMEMIKKEMFIWHSSWSKSSKLFREKPKMESTTATIPTIYTFTTLMLKHLDRLIVKFGANIVNRNNRNDGLYLSPEVLGGSISTKKSVVFCLGVILDELIHGSLFFRSMEEIQNAQSNYFVMQLNSRWEEKSWIPYWRIPFSRWWTRNPARGWSWLKPRGDCLCRNTSPPKEEAQ